MSGAYNGLASFGKFMSKIQFGIAAFFSIFLLLIGIGLYVRADKQPKDQQSSQKKSGAIFLAFGVFIALMAGIQYKMAQTYKPVAAIDGAFNIVDMFRK